MDLRRRLGEPVTRLWRAPVARTPQARHRRRALAALSATAVSAVSLVALAPGAGAATSAYGASITIKGHGFGHGRGLGQYGAYGYAVDLGWDVTAILDHYYGGTSRETVDPTSGLSVRLLEHDGREVIITHDQGRLLTSAAPGVALTAIKVTEPAPDTLVVFQGTACNGGPGGWLPLATITGSGGLKPRIDVDVLDGNDDTTVASELLAVCEPDGQKRWYRGDLTALLDANGAPRLVNHTTIERYLRGVVPRESPASWADAGGGRGIEALKAQAVAARTYAMSENRYSYAKLCDTQSCQVYSGAALASSWTGSPTWLEDARADRAIADTAGRVRFLNGKVARAEFSSSTGGWTAGGSFPVVRDEGDATRINPNSTWTTTLSTSTVMGKYPQLGGLSLIEVTSRNGIGDWGGRVLKLVLRGPSGSVTLTGDEFRRAFGLKSDWFNIESVPAGTPAPPTTPPATPGTPTVRSLGIPVVGVASAGAGGYWVTSAAGAIVAMDGAPDRGSMAGTVLNQPVIGITSAGSSGYWLLARDGGIFSFGVSFFGSTGDRSLPSPIVAMAGRRQADGYWMVRADGGVYAFGAAKWHGSMGGKPLNKPIVSMAATASGQGYWLIAADGGMFAFGDAVFAGSTGATGTTSPVVAMAARPQGDGYWIATADGQVFAFGAAPDLGGVNTLGPVSPVTALSPSVTGNGYRVITADGTVYGFGDGAA